MPPEPLACAVSQGCRAWLPEKERKKIQIETSISQRPQGYCSGFHSLTNWRYFGITERQEVDLAHNKRDVNNPRYMTRD